MICDVLVMVETVRSSALARGRVGGRRPKLTADQVGLAQQLYDAPG